MAKHISDKATATIGDAILYGALNYHDGTVTFIGDRVKLKRPLKNIGKTLVNRLENLKTCTITGAHGDKWTTKDKCQLIGYSVIIPTVGFGRITFTLKEIK